MYHTGHGALPGASSRGGASRQHLIITCREGLAASMVLSRLEAVEDVVIRHTSRRVFAVVDPNARVGAMADSKRTSRDRRRT
jgi:hypothetical protein